MITQTRNFVRSLRNYVAIGIAALALAAPAYATNEQDNYRSTNIVYELPIENSTREVLSNSAVKAKNQEQTELKRQQLELLAKRNIAKRQISRIYTQYTNSLAQARTIFNDGLKDGTLSVDEQKNVLDKYSEASRYATEAEEIARKESVQGYEDFSLSKVDKNLSTGLYENINNHDQNAVASLESSLKSQGITAKVDFHKRHSSFPFASFFLIYWFLIRRRN